MRKTIIRYFFDFLNGQENWLNKMANKGWKLTRTSKLLYEFEQCSPGQYEYRVEFVAHMSSSEAKEYINFLEDYGYNVFVKNTNLNYSIGKIRWRPWATVRGQISTSPGSYNKELLVVERKKESTPFKLHTELDDLIKYIKPIRNAYLFTAILLVFISCSFSANIANIFSTIIFIFLSFLTIAFLIKAIKYSKMLSNYKKQSKLYE